MSYFPEVSFANNVELIMVDEYDIKLSNPSGIFVKTCTQTSYSATIKTIKLITVVKCILMVNIILGNTNWSFDKH